MVRKFSHQEMTLIRGKLLEAGRDLFARQGLAKTSIKELTGAAGIAQGTFYKFFESKEALFFVLVEEEEAKIKEELFQVLPAPGKLTRKKFVRFMTAAIRSVGDNALLRLLLTGDAYETMMLKLSSDTLEEHSKKDVDQFEPLIRLWQQEGRMQSMPPELIINAIRALVLMSLHRKELGESLYDSTMSLLIEGLAFRLIGEEESDD